MGKPRKKKHESEAKDGPKVGQNQPKREKAAQLVADDKIGDVEIARTVGIARSTLTLWKKKSDFQAMVAGYKRGIAKHFISQGIRDRESRIKNLQNRIDLMTKLLAARAEDQKDVTGGGELGLMARDYKGRNADRAVYRFDDKLVKELREHEKQLAIELGEWNEKGIGTETPTNDKVIDLITLLYNDAKSS